MGINFVYTHNYGCEPGSHLSFAEVLRAADDVGMLVAFSQPHFSHYDWKATRRRSRQRLPDACRFYARMARNHPSIVFYSMSHNATGYDEDMNPDLIDGVHDPRDTLGVEQRSSSPCEPKPSSGASTQPRIVYHHSSGNLGSMHTSQLLPQLRSDPGAVRLVRSLGSVRSQTGIHMRVRRTIHLGLVHVPRLVQGAEVFRERPRALGVLPGRVERAVSRRQGLSDQRRWRRQTCAGRPSNFVPATSGIGGITRTQLGSRRFDDRHEVIGRYLTDNFRAFRTWGVSAISPWEYGHFWKLRDGVDRRRQELPVDWEKLQKPGFSRRLSSISRTSALTWLMSDRIGHRPPTGRLCCATTSPCSPISAVQSLTSRVRTITSGRGRRSRSKSSSSTIRVRPLTLIATWSLGLSQPVAGRKVVTLRHRAAGTRARDIRVAGRRSLAGCLRLECDRHV